tara:strand:- start:138 stop:404 length:267 start_codon:yes stop_codon:yes gene_type:complete
MPKKKISFLDLHGTHHDDADFVIEKFITDHFQKMPIKIITGYSDFFVDKIKFYANKYELGCYPETPDNEGCWVFFLDDWKKVLDSKTK